ncbi:MAG: PLP-dependent aminotransferase family protein, partial [Peptostreptococcus sp.]|nr:PLP-dependent aminotransferase family protein [Peptostreptococcus sp.]
GYYSRDFVDFIYKKGVVVQSGAKYFDNDIDDRYFRVNIVSENISRIREAINIIRQGLIEFYDAGK